MLLRGAGCCLWTRGFSGCRVRPRGRAAPWAARPRAVRVASFDRRVVSLSGLAPPPACTAVRVHRSQAPPPTGTAAALSGALHTCGAFAADVDRRVDALS